MSLSGLVEGTLQQDILDINHSHYIPQVQIILRDPNIDDRKKMLALKKEYACRIC